MATLRRIFCISFVAAFVILRAPELRASAYDAHPKLVVVVVIDQFRGDYLDRYRASLGTHGFRLFLDHGAYFEDCYYNYANTETVPGHATLGTGVYSNGHGIASDSWWDLSRNKKRPITSVEDERYHLVGLPNASAAGPGASPLNLRASTLGDSLRLATQGQAKVFSISLKDGAAILPVGYSANGAFWIDAASGAFTTSSYYMTALPGWAADFNASGRAGQARDEAGASDSASFYGSVGATPAANSYELDFARALITGEQLGKDPVTDLLVVSLSANDIGGHRFGPDSEQQEAMVDDLDQQLDSFFTWLDKNIPGGLANVWIALSADHGVAPVPAQAEALGLPAASIDVKKLTASLNAAMNNKFSPGENVPYLMPQQSLPYLALNEPSFEVAGINEQEAEQAVQKAVPAAFAALAPPPDATLPAPAPPPAAASPAAPASPSTPKSPSQPASTPPQKSAPAASSSRKKPNASAHEPDPVSGQPAGKAAAQAPATKSAPSAPGSGPQEPQKPSQSSTGAAPGGAANGATAGAGALGQAAGAPAPAESTPPPPLVRFQPAPTLERTYTRVQLASGQFAASDWGRLLAHSYSPNGGWYVMVIPAAFEVPTLSRGTTHFTPWSYDRHVPLAFYGAPFSPGIYHGRVEPVDLAATLASLLGINQPSASIGQVLTEAIRKVPPPAPARASSTHRRSARSHAASREPASSKKEPEKR